MTEAKIDQFRNFVSMGSGLSINHVIPGEENPAGVAPLEPFATVREITDRQIGFKSPRNGNVYLIWRLAELSLQFYRKGANDAAFRFAGWVETDQGLEQADIREFRLGLPLDVRDVSAAIADDWEERRLMKIVLEYAQLAEQTVADIESAELNFFLDINLPASLTDQETIDAS